MSMERKLALRILNKVIDAGYTDEKAITGLTTEMIIHIPNITIADINGIMELQKAIKAGKVISFLAGPQQKKQEVTSDGSYRD